MRVDNSAIFRPHNYDPIHIDMDFWEWGAEYAKKKQEELREKYQEQDYSGLYPKRTELKPEQYGGIFDPYDEYDS